VSTTAAPIRASLKAIASPMPRAAPVTTATCLLNGAAESMQVSVIVSSLELHGQDVLAQYLRIRLLVRSEIGFYNPSTAHSKKLLVSFSGVNP
jgi:hypothetical protein